MDYLKSLGLTEEQESKLRALAARTPASLMAMLEKVPEKMASFLGADLVARLRQELPGMISDKEASQMADLPPFRGKFGATIVK